MARRFVAQGSYALRAPTGTPRMRQRGLVTFNVLMVVVYLVIIGAFEAGWTRLGFGVWTAAAVTVLVVMLAFVVGLLALRGSK